MLAQNSQTASFIALLFICLMLAVQMLIAGSSKARLPGAIPGKLDPDLGHKSFVYRAHRTFQNSLENMPLLLGAALLALQIDTPADWTATFLWTFAIARLIHMVLYYAIATDKNPSPRSYFYLLALAANMGLLGLCGVTLL